MIFHSVETDAGRCVNTADRQKMERMRLKGEMLTSVSNF